MPEMNDLVPSIGSSTQTYSASVRSLPNSSPTMPCVGKVRSDQRAHRVLGGAVGRGDRIEAAAEPLFSTPSEVRKNGRIASPDTVASSVDKGSKINGSHAPFWVVMPREPASRAIERGSSAPRGLMPDHVTGDAAR